MADKQLKLALIGFGNAAQAFARLLAAKERQIYDKFSTKVLVSAVAGNRKGVIIDHNGIDLARVMDFIKTHGTFEGFLPGMDTFKMIEAVDADAVIELSPLSIKDGQPAINHIKAAFNKGMHVITANKGPVAWAFKELNETAKKLGLIFLYETVVMDGAPVFNLAKYNLRGCEILSFEGILNTTTNFILERMEKGDSFECAVLEAQKRGFAEADPTMDINGMDAAAKTCALINALMNCELNPPMIETHGIDGITAKDLLNAKKRGETIKLLCKGYKDEKGAHGIVKPTARSLSNPFASVNGTSSALSLETDLMGKLTIIEQDPEIEQTAYGIYSDLLLLISKLQTGIS